MGPSWNEKVWLPNSIPLMKAEMRRAAACRHEDNSYGMRRVEITCSNCGEILGMILHLSERERLGEVDPQCYGMAFAKQGSPVQRSLPRPPPHIAVLFRFRHGSLLLQADTLGMSLRAVSA